MNSLRVEAESVLEIAQRLKDRFWITLGLRSKEDAAHLIGDWQAARSFSDQGLELSPSETRNLCTRAMLEYETGNFGEANQYQKSLFDLASRTGTAPTVDRGFCAIVIPLAARITGRRDLLPQARATGEQLLATTSKAGHIDLFARVGLGMLAVVEQDKDLARQQYEALKAFRGLWVLFTMTSVDRVLGLLAATLGETESAQSHFQDAIDNCRRAGYRPELAWSLCDFSEMLLALGSPTGSTGAERQVQAMSQLDEALALAEELDMIPLKHRISTLLASANESPQSTTNPDGLTDREVEVLRFVAQGLSNKDIADQLILSQRTVQRHRANIYQKIDVHNRAEATAYVMNRLPL